MSLTEILKQKREQSVLIKTKYNLLKSNKALGLIKISDKKILSKLIKAFYDLDVDFVIVSDNKDLKATKNVVITTEIYDNMKIGFDFVVCDHKTESIQSFFDAGVTPIIQSNHPMSAIFTQFNPVKAEGNSYIYDKKNGWSIFASIVRYLENYKFLHDNRNLVKNVVES